MTTPPADHALVAPKPRSIEGGLGLLAPPAAWAAQEWLGWYFGQRICQGLPPSSVRSIVLGVSVAALVVCLAGVARGWRAWRGGGAVDTDHRDRGDFLAFGGLLVSSVFTIAVIWGALPGLFLSDCGWMR